jgi:asparagine synthase (glutamine-hydrolysing)
MVIQMSNQVKHRGPDDEGFALFQNIDPIVLTYGGGDTPAAVYKSSLPYSPDGDINRDSAIQTKMALGHRRLSIIDLSPTGHQPMCTGDQRYWIVYNGEIYNYREIREQFAKLGHQFYSLSDTEIILKAYQKWGAGCLKQLNGMFAFVIYDVQKQMVFMARDRYGIKPLYYWFSPKGFLAIASEIKQFTVLSGWNALLNAQRAYEYLNWGLTDHTDETLFQGVKQLRGGFYAEFSIENLENILPITQWYHIKSAGFKGSMNEAIKQFQVLFNDSIRLRLRSDVPVGSCLSGGLDSSSIVCTVNNILREQGVEDLQKTFSARAHIRRFDEGEFIDAVVSRTNIEDHHVYPTFDALFSAVDNIIWHQDEPFNSSSIFAQWQVFKLAASNGVKVMLDGQGADELLAGYTVYFPTLCADLFLRLQWMSLWDELQCAKRHHGLQYQGAVKQIFNMLLPNYLRQPLKRLVGKASVKTTWLNLKRLDVKNTDPFFERGSIGASVNDLSYSQLTSTHLPMLLHWEDRDSMAHSVESRVPFLDYRLVEFLLSLPANYKISEGTTKRILRESMNGVLPEKIRNRMDKVGFVTPEEIWLKESSTDEFRKLLNRSVQTSRGILNINAIKKLENIVAGKESFDYAIWRMICFGRWMEGFNVSIASG